MSPIQRLKNSGNLRGMSYSKFTSVTEMQKSPVNESLLPHKEKIPKQQWYYAISHSVRMSNISPGKMSCHLKTPYVLVYDVKLDAQSCFLILSVGYFHNQIYGSVTRSSTQSQTLAGGSICQATDLNKIQFYNPLTIIVYTTVVYKLDPGHHNNTNLSLTYNGGIFVGTYR